MTVRFFCTLWVCIYILFCVGCWTNLTTVLIAHSGLLSDSLLPL